jgi:hypothetical protein
VIAYSGSDVLQRITAWAHEVLNMLALLANIVVVTVFGDDPEKIPQATGVREAA